MTFFEAPNFDSVTKIDPPNVRFGIYKKAKQQFTCLPEVTLLRSFRTLTKFGIIILRFCLIRLFMAFHDAWIVARLASVVGINSLTKTTATSRQTVRRAGIILIFVIRLFSSFCSFVLFLLFFRSPSFVLSFSFFCSFVLFLLFFRSLSFYCCK